MAAKVLVLALAFAAGALAVVIGSFREESLPFRYKGYTVEDWTETLKSPDLETRRAAAEMIAQIGPNAKGAVPDLVEALNDSDEVVRRYALQGLGNIGPDAKEAVAEIREKIMTTDNKGFLKDGIRALRQIEVKNIGGQKPVQ